MLADPPRLEDGTDIYWARSRVLEYLNFAQKRLPTGVTPSLGPDATGVGWVFEYAVIGAKRTLAELRAIQDWLLRYQLTKADEAVGHQAALLCARSVPACSDLRC
jgi:Cu(I)/Ag(I) efflux system membrane protein CusA/SilA